jgi:hypothetical protein
LLFNDIFYNNWAGTKGTNTVTGITPGDADPWDMGVAGMAGNLLSPTNSILQPSAYSGVIADGSNSSADPMVVLTNDIPLSFTTWRTNVNFLGAIMVTADLPPNLLGDYHLQSGSPAIDTGAATKMVPSYQQPPNSLAAPIFDIDNQARPFAATQGGPPSTKYDMGADEWQ